MRQVFISYSTKDQLQAEAVRNVIEQNGISCWMAPRDIPGGSNYTKEIPNAIRDCQAFVLMLSQNAQASPWVLKELDRAVNEGKTILPFQLEDITLNDEFNFLLTGAQRYDAYQKKSEALQLLIARIKAIISTDSGTDAPVTEEPAPKKEPTPVISFTEKKPNKQAPVFNESYGTAVCPACGSLDVQRLKGKIKPRDPAENLVRIVAIAVGLLVFPFVVFIVSYVASDLFFYNTDLDMDIYEAVDFLVGALSLASLFVGPWLGIRLSGEWIRRRRIRSHREVDEFRCNTCRKQFLPEKKES